MALRITDKTIRQFIETVSDQHHAMAGAVIAVSAAHAAALGEACMQISLENQVDKLDWQDVTARISQMVHIKNTLVEWCDQDANTIADHVALREAGDDFSHRTVLCEAPAEIGHLSAEAAEILQNFRPLVFEQVQDDLEMALSLLAGTARAALLLLDSNLRIWSEPALLEEFGPTLFELEVKINQLSPVSRIR